MVNNRKYFGALLPGVDHIRHTHDYARNAYSRGLPAHGAEFADDLERLVALHDASTIAAVIVEPIAGSTGVLLPPRGYLERLREICTRHGILLIFDEVITGFGRTGSAFAAQEFGVVPDMMTCAKGLTNGAIPMGAVMVRREIYDAFMTGPEQAIELFHGYTYSAHPVACAAGLATQKLYRDGLFEKARAMAPYWENAVHAVLRPGRGHRARAARRPAWRARLRGAGRGFRAGAADAHDRRHDRALAATHHRAYAGGPDLRNHRCRHRRAEIGRTGRRPPRRTRKRKQAGCEQPACHSRQLSVNQPYPAPRAITRHPRGTSSRLRTRRGPCS
jgi:hypothetical protein